MRNPTREQEQEYRWWFDISMRLYSEIMVIKDRSAQERKLLEYACGDIVLLMLDGEDYTDSIWLKVYPQYDVELFLRESNAIEGVYDPNSLKQAMEAWDYLIAQKTLTTNVILKTHKILMLNQPLTPDNKGYFRKVGVTIGGRMGLHYSEIAEAVKNWRYLVKETISTYSRDPEKAIRFTQEDHVRYEAIHPFIDGNGRTGRMFLNWERVQCGLPILVIKDKDKQEYYKWFQ